jgi:hypothetical protein
MDRADHMADFAPALPRIACTPIEPLPDWLGQFALAGLAVGHPWSRRFASLTSQAAPALACGMDNAEIEHVAGIIRGRLLLDTSGITLGSRADAALDDWLVARIVQSASWSASQRRAWWQVERLSLIVDILDRWTRAHLLDSGVGAMADTEVDARAISGRWLDVAEECWNWGEEVFALFAHRISENLLDCAWSVGHRNLTSLRRACGAAR